MKFTKSDADIFFNKLGKLFKPVWTFSKKVAINTAIATKYTAKYGLGLAVGLSLTGVATGYYAYDIPISDFPSFVERGSLAFYAVIASGLHYKQLIKRFKKGTEEYDCAKEIIDTQCAERLLKVCLKNGGIYTKVGQHIASLNHIVPPAYPKILSVLQDKAKSLEYSEIEGLLESELGAPVQKIFRHFNTVPIASASLAQVHFAILKTGERVAVKVQYPDIERKFKIDITTISILANMVSFFFPDFEYAWIVPEMRKNLTEELNFLNEGNNNEIIAKQFQHNKQFKTPKVYWPYTSRKILVMEFIEGRKINDVKWLRELGLDPRKVAQLLIDIFSQQIFVSGFLHCDPHPGNIFITLNQDNEPVINLLDHGLYRRIDPDIKDTYCRLNKALILRDAKGIEEYGRKIGAGNFYHLFSILLTGRPISNKDVGFKQSVKKEDIEKMRKEFQDHQTQISSMLEKLPRDLLLILKTTNIVRSINRDLGTLVNRQLVMSRFAFKGIYFDNDDNFIGDTTDYIAYLFDKVYFEVNLLGFNSFITFLTYLNSLIDWFKPKPIREMNDIDYISYAENGGRKF